MLISKESLDEKEEQLGIVHWKTPSLLPFAKRLLEVSKKRCVITECTIREVNGEPRELMVIEFTIETHPGLEGHEVAMVANDREVLVHISKKESEEEPDVYSIGYNDAIEYIEQLPIPLFYWLDKSH